MPARAQQQPGAHSNHARVDTSPYSRDGARRPVSSPTHEWDSKMQHLPGPPLRRHSQVRREARDHEDGVKLICGGTEGIKSEGAEDLGPLEPRLEATTSPAFPTVS